MPPTLSNASRAELRRALFLAWLVISAVLAAAVVVPLVASDGLISAVVPACVWKTQFGLECPACGLTTAFVLIGDGQWASAWTTHRGAIPLFGAFVVNSSFWTRTLARLLRAQRG